MIDPDDYYKIKKYVIENYNKIKNETDIIDIIEKLQIIDYNERSIEITSIAEKFHDKVKERLDNESLFMLKNILFLQRWLYPNKLDLNEQLLKEMLNIALELKNKLLMAICNRNEALLLRLKGKTKQAFEKIKKAYSISKEYRNLPKDKEEYVIFIDFTYSYVIFNFDMHKEINFLELIDECIGYYYNSYKNRAYVSAITLKLFYYARTGQREQGNQLVRYLEDEKIHLKLTLDQKRLFFYRVGKYFYLTYQLNKAEEYLELVYQLFKETGIRSEDSYIYIAIINFLARNSAFKGDLDKAIEFLKETYTFLQANKEELVKRTYDYENLRIFSTFHFVLYHMNKDTKKFQEERFAQILEDITNIADNFFFQGEHLLTIEAEQFDKLYYDRIETAEEILELFFLREHGLNYREKIKQLNEKISQKENTIEYRLYNRLQYCKLLLSLGVFKDFHSILNEVREDIEKTEIVFLKLLFELYDIIDFYLKDREENKEKALNKLTTLEKSCNEKNMFKLTDEIEMYKTLISSKVLADKYEEQFKYVAYYNIYEEESKKAVLDFLKQK
ncbi:MAG: hypothetical protein ACTSPI_02400 [Candidatus Heimdallarchaeaceae archaeon]